MQRFKKLTDNYTVIPNQIFSVEGVSAEAKLVYIYLRSKPPTWQPNMKDIERSVELGRAKTMRCRAELIAAGMLSYQRLKEGGGIYTLHEITTVQKTDSGKATSGLSSPLVSKERVVNTDSYKSDSEVNQKSKEQNTTIPTTNKDLNSWSKDRNGPESFIGEDSKSYRQRLFRWDDAGRPPLKPDVGNPMMDLPGSHDDLVASEQKRMAEIPVTGNESMNELP